MSGGANSSQILEMPGPLRGRAEGLSQLTLAPSWAGAHDGGPWMKILIVGAGEQGYDRIRPRGVLPPEGLERGVRLAYVQELKKNGIAIARRSEHWL